MRAAVLLSMAWAVAACTKGASPEVDAASPPLTLSSRTVDLKMRYGESASGEVRVLGRLAAAARLAVRSVDPPGPVVTIVSGGGGGAAGVRVVHEGTRVGRVSGQVVLDTGIADPTTLTLLYSWQVTGNLTIDPTNPFIDVRAAEPGGVDIHVSSSRRDLRLDDARIVDGPFLATLHRDGATGSYVVHVVVRTDAPGDARGRTGTVRLESNDPAEPERDVPLFALGAFDSRP
jgi:hypothetical protein